MNNFQIETAHNVKISQNIASIGDRIAASAIDFMIFYFYGIFVVILLISSNIRVDDDKMMILYSIILIPIIVYHLLFEYFMDGQSPGKRLVKIKVVKLDGSKAGFSNYLLRWMFRIIDTPIFGIVGIITFLVNGKGQRVGDIVAGTTVISLKEEKQDKNAFIEIKEDYVPTYDSVTFFSDDDILKIKDIYINAIRTKNHRLLKQLREKVEHKLNLQSDMNDIQFVKTIIKDYYFYTQNITING
jgi:uncharacterized RDD family membrane protein YckC